MGPGGEAGGHGRACLLAARWGPAGEPPGTGARAAGCINMQFFKWQYLEKYARLFEKNARVFGKNWHFR